MADSRPSPYSARLSSPPPDLRERLVAAVARDDRALRIRPDNSSGGFTSIAAALRAQDVFAVVCRPDVVVFDADTPTAVSAADRLVAEMRAAGYDPVVLASGGPGRRHVFCVVPDARRAATWRTAATRAQIDVRLHQPIRPPGVPHRSGAQPVLLSHTDWEAAVRALELSGAASLDGLPPAVRVMVLRGDFERKFVHPSGRTDFSRLTLAICHRAVATGADPEALYRALLRPTAAAGAGLRRRLARNGTDSARVWFFRAWAKAASALPQAVSARPDPEVALAIAAVLGCFVLEPRPGRTANSDVSVFVAALALAARSGSLTAVPMSIRALAQLSGRDPKTVRHALARLVVQGHLAPHGPAHLDAAATWDITRERDEQRNSSPHSLRPGGGVKPGGDLFLTSGALSVLASLVAHDAFAAGALGPGAWRVLVAVVAGATRCAEMAELTGMHVVSVRRLVRRLCEAGLLVANLDGSYDPVQVWDLPHVATGEVHAVLGAVLADHRHAGRALRRQAQFAAERLAYRQALVRLDPTAVGALQSRAGFSPAWWVPSRTAQRPRAA